MCPQGDLETDQSSLEKEEWEMTTVLTMSWWLTVDPSALSIMVSSHHAIFTGHHHLLGRV